MQLKTPRDLAMRLKEARQEQGLSQAQLANRIGVSRRWVSQLESGKKTLEVGLVLRAITALGLECDVRPRASAGPGQSSTDLGSILKSSTDG